VTAIEVGQSGTVVLGILESHPLGSYDALAVSLREGVNMQSFRTRFLGFVSALGALAAIAGTAKVW
jgi:hypothetical protein